MQIKNLDLPKPRDGILGEWDKFIGPGATNAENLLIILTSVIAGSIQFLYAYFFDLNWNIFQMLIAVFLALDICGGMVANKSNALKRWYHRKGRTFKHHIKFVALHIYPFIVGFFFRNWDWIYSIVLYVFLLIAAFVVLKSPLYLRRPVAASLFLGSIIISFYVFTPVKGLEWFYTVLFLKLIDGNILKEQPYRP